MISVTALSYASRSFSEQTLFVFGMFLKSRAPPAMILGKQFLIKHKLLHVHCDAPELSRGAEGTVVH